MKDLKKQIEQIVWEVMSKVAEVPILRLAGEKPRDIATKKLDSLFKKTMEEIIGDPDENYLEWRKEVNAAYKKKKPTVLFSYNIWLDRKLRNKLK